MVSTNFIQEELSKAYVQAVIFRAGFNMQLPVKDLFGIDGTIVSHTNGVNRIDYQLKATTDYTFSGSSILYDLRVDDYNRLIREDDLPRVLILYLMPSDDSQWLIQSPRELCLRECAYWADLMGHPPSRNSSTVRVAVPTVNVFDQAGLQNMFRNMV